jgi:carbamoyl-phosphate synthase large subunit
LSAKGFNVQTVNKIRECADNNTSTLLDSGAIKYIISTSEKGRDPMRDDVKIRRKACTLGIPCLTSVDTANALADSLLSGYSEINTELIDVNSLRSERTALSFTKMHACGNDYIYINCFEYDINSPESLSVLLSDRHTGVGGDGIILILPSAVADAKMRIFNIDGSEGNQCGNGIRCVAKYLYDNGIVQKQQLTVETLAGVKSLSLSVKHNRVSSV